MFFSSSYENLNMWSDFFAFITLKDLHNYSKEPCNNLHESLNLNIVLFLFIIVILAIQPLISQYYFGSVNILSVKFLKIIFRSNFPPLWAYNISSFSI